MTAEEILPAQRRVLAELRAFDRALGESLRARAMDERHSKDLVDFETFVRVIRAWTMWAAYDRVVAADPEVCALRDAYFDVLVPRLLGGPEKRVGKDREIAYLLLLVATTCEDESTLKPIPIDVGHRLVGLSLLSHAVRVAVFFAVRFGDKEAREEIVFAEMKARYDAADRELYDASVLAALAEDVAGILKAIGPPPGEALEDALVLRRAIGRVRLRVPEARRGRRRA